MQRRMKYLESYRRMIAQLAWRTWSKLPMQIKSWIEVEDIISDGMYAAYESLRRFDPSKAMLSTYLYHEVHNYLVNMYTELYDADKRGWIIDSNGKRVGVAMYSIQAMAKAESKLGNMIEENLPWEQVPEALCTTQESIEQNVLTECFVVPAMERIYRHGSDRLQSEFINWFWYKKSKVHVKSRHFKQAAKEFRYLCSLEEVHCDDCIHLVRSLSCLDSLSRRILGMPYDMDMPTPFTHRVL
jgi:DNA-directed RNA polymerase specialized sigma24 family protein